jgi:hypothetical protein
MIVLKIDQSNFIFWYYYLIVDWFSPEEQKWLGFSKRVSVSVAGVQTPCNITNTVILTGDVHSSMALGAGCSAG